ncbi:hypothetical protein VTK26DRAFT_5457 [Humicola hyalothermophila]
MRGFGLRKPIWLRWPFCNEGRKARERRPVSSILHRSRRTILGWWQKLLRGSCENQDVGSTCAVQEYFESEKARGPVSVRLTTVCLACLGLVDRVEMWILAKSSRVEAGTAGGRGKPGVRRNGRREGREDVDEEIGSSSRLCAIPFLPFFPPFFLLVFLSSIPSIIFSSLYRVCLTDRGAKRVVPWSPRGTRMKLSTPGSVQPVFGTHSR